MLCKWIRVDSRFRCQRCRRESRRDSIRNCPTTCLHLGPPIEKDGVLVQVKCTCPDNEKGFTEQWHTAHQCSIYKRCLPGFRGPWDDDHQLEAQLYKLCYGCPGFHAKE